MIDEEKLHIFLNAIVMYSFYKRDQHHLDFIKSIFIKDNHMQINATKLKAVLHDMAAAVGRILQAPAHLIEEAKNEIEAIFEKHVEPEPPVPIVPSVTVGTPVPSVTVTNPTEPAP